MSFKWRDLPKLVDNIGCRDKVTDGVNNQTSKTAHWNVEKDGGKSVESQQDNDGSEDTSEWSPHTSLRLDSCTGERPSGRVGTKERSQTACQSAMKREQKMKVNVQIRKSHSDKFL